MRHISTTDLILHLELSDFLTEATAKRHPHLRGRPFVIAPLGADRARVQAASARARQMGIQRGMLLREAQKIERRLIVQPVEERYYAAVSRELVHIVSHYSPVVEPCRYGQAYVEIVQRGRAWERARDTAFHLQREVARRLELTPAVGLATNKLLSRAASRRAAAQHDILWVPPGHERPFIAPFAVNFLPHVTHEAAALLRNINIWRVRDLAALSRGELQEMFGRTGWRMYDEARGIDPTPVMPPERRAALYEEWAFAPETNDDGKIHAASYTLLTRLARELRRKQMVAGRIALAGTYADSRFFSNWRKLATPSAMEPELWHTLEALLERLLARRVALRRIGIRLLHLQPAAQLELFAPQVPSKQARLTAAMDRIKARYGEKAVVVGREVPSMAHGSCH